MGIENITANNGWAMAVVGYVTVIVALAILAALISCMPFIAAAIEAISPSGRAKKQTAASAKTETVPEPKEILPELNIAAITAEYGPFISQLDSPFELQAVYAVARENNLEHPHLSIRTLLENGKIVQESDGLFKWNA